MNNKEVLLFMIYGFSLPKLRDETVQNLFWSLRGSLAIFMGFGDYQEWWQILIGNLLDFLTKELAQKRHQKWPVMAFENVILNKLPKSDNFGPGFVAFYILY